MSFYYKLGNVPHKRHTQFRQPDGSLYHEEVMGLRGFSGNKSLLYHVRPPTKVRQIELACKADVPYAEQGPLRHRLLRTADVPAQGDAIQGRVPLLANDDVTISVARPTDSMSRWMSSGEIILSRSRKKMKAPSFLASVPWALRICPTKALPLRPPLSSLNSVLM